MENGALDAELDAVPSPPTVAVVGLGKIGLPLAVQFARHGCQVIGCDTNPGVVELINAGQSHIQQEPGLASAVASAVSTRVLSATLNTAQAVLQADFVVVIVPVMIGENHQIDFQSLDAATEAIGKGLQPGTLVIYETTLPVGTSSSRLCQLLERTSGLKAGQDFSLAYSPERVSSGSVFRDLRTYPKVVGAIDEQSLNAAVAFYRSVLDAGTQIITMASTDEAEFVKLIETTYRDVNIALANEFACFAGVGVGGHCIPVYPYFLLAGAQGAQRPVARAHLPELPMLLLPRSARRINDAMANYAVSRVEAIVGLLEHQSVLILGVAYRSDVREVAYTSARLLQDALREHGATVYADDPFYSEDELRVMGFMPLPPEHEEKISAIVLQAGHQVYQEYDFRRFPRCQMVLDGRRALSCEQVEALGMHYVAIGDGCREKSEVQADQSAVGAINRPLRTI